MQPFFVACVVFSMSYLERIEGERRESGEKKKGERSWM